MKKVSLLGVLLLVFVLTSFGDKKDRGIQTINQFFDKEVSYLNKIKDAEGMLQYYDDSDARFTDFYHLMDDEFAMDENGNIIGLSQEESDAVMDVYENRFNAYDNLLITKSSALYEPFVADMESVLYDEIGALLEKYDDLDNVPDEVIFPLIQKLYDKYLLAEKYSRLSDVDQFDRFLVVNRLFNDEEE